MSDEEDWDTDIDWSVNGTDIDFTEEKEHLIEREPLTLQQRMKKLVLKNICLFFRNFYVLCLGSLCECLWACCPSARCPLFFL